MLVARHEMLSRSARRRVQLPPGRPQYTIQRRRISDFSDEAELQATRRNFMTPKRSDVWPLFDVRVLEDQSGASVSFHVTISLWIYYRCSRCLPNGSNCAVMVLPLLGENQTFRSFVEVQRVSRSKKSFERAQSHWRHRIATDEIYPPPDLKHWFYNDNIQRETFYDRRGVFVSTQIWKKIEDLARRLNVTATTVLFVAFSGALAAQTGMDQLTVNLVVFTRAHQQFKAVVGDRTSTILVGCDVDATVALSELIQSFHRRLMDDLTYAEYPGVDVSKDLGKAGKETTFPVVFTTLLDTSVDVTQSDFGDIVYAVSATPSVLLDCTVVRGRDNSVSIGIDFAAHVIEGSFVEDFLESLLFTLCQFTQESAPSVPISIPLSSRQRSNIRAANYPGIEQGPASQLENIAGKFQDCVKLFEDCVREQPKHIALLQPYDMDCTTMRQVTYAELYQLMKAIAQACRKEKDEWLVYCLSLQ